MASIQRLKSGHWRAQVRRKGKVASETFILREDARRWANEAEGRADRGETPAPSRAMRARTFGQLIDLHLADMKSVDKAPGRSKDATLRMLKRELGGTKLPGLDRERLIKFGKDRAAQSAGGVTVGIDIGLIKTVLTHAAAIHGIAVKPEQVDLARIALKRLGLICKGHERDRRPTEEELEARKFRRKTLPPLPKALKFAWTRVCCIPDGRRRCNWRRALRRADCEHHPGPRHFTTAVGVSFPRGAAA